MIQTPTRSSKSQELLPDIKTSTFLSGYAQRAGFGKELSALEGFIAQAKNTNNRGLFYFLTQTLRSLESAIKTKGEVDRHKVSKDLKEEEQPAEDKPAPSGQAINAAMTKSVLTLLSDIAKKSIARVEHDPKDTWIAEDEATWAVSALRKVFSHVLGDANWKVSGGKDKSHLRFEKKKQRPIYMGWTRTVQGFVNEVIDASLKALPDTYAFHTISPSEDTAEKLIKTVTRELPQGVGDWSKADPESGMLDAETVSAYSIRGIANDLMAISKDLKKPADRIAQRISLSENAERVRRSNELQNTSEGLDEQLYILGYNIIYKLVEVAGLLNISARFNIATKVNETLLQYLAASESGGVAAKRYSLEYQHITAAVPAFQKLGFYDTQLMEAVQRELKNKISTMFSQDSLYQIALSIFSSMFDLEKRSGKENKVPKLSSDAKADKEAKKNDNKAVELEDFDTEENIPGAYKTNVRDLSTDEKAAVVKGKLKEETTKQQEAGSRQAGKQEAGKAVKDNAAVMFKACLGIRALMSRVVESLGMGETLPGVDEKGQEGSSNREALEKLQTMYMDSLMFVMTGNRHVSEYAPGGGQEGGYRRMLTDSIAKHWIERLGLNYSAGLSVVNRGGVPVFFEPVYTPSTRKNLIRESNRTAVEAIVQRLEFLAFKIGISEKLPMMSKTIIAEANQNIIPRVAKISELFLAMQVLAQEYATTRPSASDNNMQVDLQQQQQQQSGIKLVDLVSRVFGSSTGAGQLEGMIDQLLIYVAKVHGLEAFNAKAYEKLANEFSAAVEERDENDPESGYQASEAQFMQKGVDFFANQITQVLDATGLRKQAATFMSQWQNLYMVLDNCSRAAGMINTERPDNVAGFVNEYAPLVLKSTGSSQQNLDPVRFSKPLRELAAKTEKLNIAIMPHFGGSSAELIPIFMQAVTTIAGEGGIIGQSAKKIQAKAKLVKTVTAVIEGGKKGEWPFQIVNAAKKFDPAERRAYFERETRRVMAKFSDASINALSAPELDKPIEAEKEFNPDKNFDEYVRYDMFNMDYKPQSVAGEGKGKRGQQDSLRDRNRTSRESKQEIVAAMQEVFANRKYIQEINNELMLGIMATRPELFPKQDKKLYLQGTKKVFWKSQEITLWELASLITGKVMISVKESMKSPLAKKVEPTDG